MAVVALDGVRKTFDGTVAVDGVSFAATEGEFLVIVGPSGCGKSTILRLVAGLEIPDTGRILIDDDDVTHRPPNARRCAMVFQSYALYPHWTVFDNLAFPLRVRHVSRAEIKNRVARIADTLQLTTLLTRRPKALSGGQRQRVALGRAMAADPRIFLLDEPLSNLDAPLRAEMRHEIVARQKAMAKTTLYVTHDQTEALTMADRVLVLDRGVVMGLGSPTDLYENPPNRFVATFLGRPAINLLAAGLTDVDGIARLDPVGWVIAPHTARALEQQGTPRALECAVRPEHVVIASADTGSRWRITAREFLGDKLQYTLADGTHTLVALTAATSAHPVGANVRIEIDPERILLFDPATGCRLA